MSRLDGTLDRLQRCDEWLCIRLCKAQRLRALREFFRAISWLGDGILWYALMLALLLRHGVDAVPAVLHMALVGAACTTTYRLIKRGTSRPRPYQTMPAVAAAARPLDAYSFPSGHTLHAVAFSLVAGAWYPELGVALAVFTLLTAASRVMLGLHYPSDVLAGAGIGGIIAGGTLLI